VYACIPHNIYTVKSKIKWKIEKKTEVFFESSSFRTCSPFFPDKSDNAKKTVFQARRNTAGMKYRFFEEATDSRAASAAPRFYQWRFRRAALLPFFFASDAFCAEEGFLDYCI